MDVFDSSGSLNRTAINQHLVGENDNLIFPWKVVKVIYEAHDCQKGITLLFCDRLWWVWSVLCQ